MGADMSIMFIPAVKWNEERESVLQTLLSKTTVGEIKEYYQERDISDELFTDEEYISRYKEEFEKRMSFYWTEMGDCRSVSTQTIDGKKYYFTGGLSWGDDPTDTFNDMREIEALPGVIQLLEKWQEEDRMR